MRRWPEHQARLAESEVIRELSGRITELEAELKQARTAPF
jgi:hypothetical protein